MSDLLPIVAGCKAIIHGALFKENNGKEVDVVRYIGERDDEQKNGVIWFFDKPPYWEVLQDVVTGDSSYQYYSNMVSESLLMRIDGYKESDLDHAMDLADKVGREFMHVYNGIDNNG